MLREMAIFVLMLIGCVLLGCNKTLNDDSQTSSLHTTQSQADAEVNKTMDQFFEEGLKRPFGAGGPRFDLPASYYGYFNAHAQLAMEMLDRKLSSDNAIVRVNAYDIITRLAQVDLARAWALNKIENAMDHEGLAARNVVRSEYDQMRTSSTGP